MRSLTVAQILCATTYGGAEAAGAGLATALRPAVERSLLYLILESRAGRGEGLLQQLQDAGHQLRVFESHRRFDWPLRTKLLAALTADGVDIAHCHSYKPAALLYGAAARPPLVFTAHGFSETRRRERWLERLYAQMGFVAADATTTVAHTTATAMRWGPLDRRRISVVPNGLSFPVPQPSEVSDLRQRARSGLAEQWGLDASVPWTLALGRLVPVKGFDVMLEAALRVFSRHSGVLLIAGDGPERPTLEALVRHLDLTERVRLLGHQSVVGPLYAAADVVVLASHSEACPMVVLESLAYGRPVVATAVGAIPDLIANDVNGRVVRPNDVNALAEAWHDALVDGSRRKRWGAAGRTFAAEHLSPDQWRARYMTIYAGAVARRRGSGR